VILFWTLAAGLTAAVLALLLPPLLRRRIAAPDARVAANAAVYREQLEELGAELQRGALTKDEYERASREVERRIVAEHAERPPEEARHRAPLAAAIAVGLLVPLASVLAYLQLGEPRALDAAAARQADPQQLEALVERLSGHLRKTPDDAEGWALLGRALSALGRHERAAQSLARAVQLQPEDRDLLVEFLKALALAGRAEFEQGNYAAAIGYWERIRPFAPPESEFARMIADSIAEARSLAGAPAGPALRGVVSLAPALQGKLPPETAVFIAARAPGGSRMPLAAARTTVGQLPYSFALDDSMAMAPGAKLSGQAQVVVVARVSKSGDPVARKGDLEGRSAAVKPDATGVQVVISKPVD
jgi:cytochrome c-type biogenesis protein CcmH